MHRLLLSWLPIVKTRASLSFLGSVVFDRRRAESAKYVATFDLSPLVQNDQLVQSGGLSP